MSSTLPSRNSLTAKPQELELAPDATWKRDTQASYLWWYRSRDALDLTLPRNNSTMLLQLHHEQKIPPNIADHIFTFRQCLPMAYAKTIPEEFLQALPKGVNLSGVWPAFAIWLMLDPDHGVIRHTSMPPERLLLTYAAQLYLTYYKMPGNRHEYANLSEWQKLANYVRPRGEIPPSSGEPPVYPVWRQDYQTHAVVYHAMLALIWDTTREARLASNAPEASHLEAITHLCANAEVLLHCAAQKPLTKHDHAELFASPQFGFLLSEIQNAYEYQFEKLLELIRSANTSGDWQISPEILDHFASLQGKLQELRSSWL